MFELTLAILRPLLLGLAAAAPLAAVLWWRSGRRAVGDDAGAPGAMRGRSRVAAVIGLAIPLLGTAVLSASDLFVLTGMSPPDWYSESLQHTRRNIVAPLVFGVLGALVLLLPAQHPSPRTASLQGGAGPTRRTAFSVTRPLWLAPALVALPLILITTGLAGGASSPDEEGRRTLQVIDPGGGASASSGIYGWYFSVPALILLAVLLAVLVFGLHRIARPSSDTGAEPVVPTQDAAARDAAERRGRTLCLIALVTGALLLHLGSIFTDLSNTALSVLSFRTEHGMVTVGSSFAALATPLRIAGDIIAPLAYFVWFSALLPLLLPYRSPSPPQSPSPR